MEIFKLLRFNEAGHAGTLEICTEAWTRYHLEPFRCEATQLREFVNNYDIEMCFDGDVIILGALSRTLTVYHHAGGYAHARLNEEEGRRSQSPLALRCFRKAKNLRGGKHLPNLLVLE